MRRPFRIHGIAALATVVALGVAHVGRAQPATAPTAPALAAPASVTPAPVVPAIAPAALVPGTTARPEPGQSPPTPVVAPAPQAPPAPTRAPRAAQPAQPAEAPAVADTPRPPRPRGQPINVRFDVTATDQSGGRPPVTKTMTLTVADGDNARVRNSLESVPQGASARNAFFSVDLRASVEGERVRADFGLDYNAFDDTAGVNAVRSTANVRLQQGLVLENGKSIVVSQSTDPMTDRKFIVEVKATILR